MHLASVLGAVKGHFGNGAHLKDPLATLQSACAQILFLCMFGRIHDNVITSSVYGILVGRAAATSRQLNSNMMSEPGHAHMLPAVGQGTLLRAQVAMKKKRGWWLEFD